MSIENRLLSAGSAWRESQPPVAVEPLVEVRRKPALWLPLTAAAATVAVVVGASLLVSRNDSPAPVASGVVAWADLAPRESDVPAPQLDGLDGRLPSELPGCTGEEMGGMLRLTGTDIGVVSIVPTTLGCRIEGDGTPMVAVQGVDGGDLGVVSVRAQQAVLPLPPGYPEVVVTAASPLLLPVRWAGSVCAEGPLRATVSGLAELSFRVGVESAPACNGPAASRIEVTGVPHAAGVPSAFAPAERAELQVSIEAAERPDSAGLRYIVALTNPTSRPIALSPCPAYAWTLESYPRTPPGGYPTPDSGGGVISPGFGVAGGVGRLNCDAAPEAVAAGQTLRFAMRIPAELTHQDAAKATITWAIAGPAAAVSDTSAQPNESSEPVEPSTGPGTTTSLRADLDDDGRPDVATVNSLSGQVTVGLADGKELRLVLPASVTLEVQGVVDLPGPDGLLVSTTAAAREAAQTAVVLRVVDESLIQLRYSDGDHEPVELQFNNGRGDQWDGVRCTATGLRVLHAALSGETNNPTTVAFREQDLVLGPDGLQRGETRVKGAPTASTGEAISTAAQLAATSCAGLTARGISRGERSVTYAR